MHEDFTTGKGYMKPTHFSKFINQRKDLFSRHVASCILLAIRYITMDASFITTACQFKLQSVQAWFALSRFKHIVLSIFSDMLLCNLSKV